MGLLDALYNSGGQNSGLLDFLRSNGFNQQFNSGLPSDQAQYGPMFAQQAPQQSIQANQPAPMFAQSSPLDNAQWPYGPNGAPSQANAQIPQQPPAVIPAQAQDTGSGIGDRFGSAFRGLLANAHTGPIGAILGGVAGAAGMGQGDGTGAITKALLAKGIDPVTVRAAIADPKIREELIKQTYGPQTVQALGSGYIRDPRTGQITRAYEPDDKIPFGWAKDDKGNVNYIPNGPADPKYLRLAEAQKKDPTGNYTLGKGGEIVRNNPDGTVTVVHKNAESDEATISEDTAKLLANRVLMGDTKALVGLGRGAQGAANILKIHDTATKIAADKGIDAKGILDNVAQQAGLVSASRALGTKETHFGVAEKAMEESLPIAQAASDAVPRSDWLHLNKLIQLGQTEHTNPLLKRFLIATDTAAKDYARTINPTGALRESDIEYARKILSTADGPDAYKAGLDQLRIEAGVMHRAIQRQKTELHGSTSKEAAPASGAYVWSPDKGLSPK